MTDAKRHELEQQLVAENLRLIESTPWLWRFQLWAKWFLSDWPIAMRLLLARFLFLLADGLVSLAEALGRTATALVGLDDVKQEADPKGEPWH